jgi:hypothetical protein
LNYTLVKSISLKQYDELENLAPINFDNNTVNKY